MSDGNRHHTGGSELTEGLPTERLFDEAKSLVGALLEKALESAGQKVSETTHGLIEKVESGDGSPGTKALASGARALSEGKSPARAVLGAGVTGVKEKAKQIFSKGGKKGLKVTNLVETLDVGAPLRLTYDQWTRYEDFPTFMKKLESAERPEDEKSTWKAHIWWSHRSWESTTVEQVPDDHIVWRSKGAKGYVDGAVSFSRLAPNLTRICLVMEYQPQGFVEHTGNLWRAQGRRARLELKHFRRHVMAHAILHPDEVEGWRGEIRDGEIVRTHEEALEQEEQEHAEESQEDRAAPEEAAPEEEEEKEPGGEPEPVEDEEEEEEEGEEEEEEPETEAEEKPRRAHRPRSEEDEEDRPRASSRRRSTAERSERPARSRPATGRRSPSSRKREDREGAE